MPGRGPYYYRRRRDAVAYVSIVEPPPPLPPLMRLQGVIDVFGFSRDEIEILCRDGHITPFHKTKTSKALYRIWQLVRYLRLSVRIQPQPPSHWLRRAEVARWLRVPCAEIESWVRLGIVKRYRDTQEHISWKLRNKGWGYFDREEIRRKVLALNASKTR